MNNEMETAAAETQEEVISVKSEPKKTSRGKRATVTVEAPAADVVEAPAVSPAPEKKVHQKKQYDLHDMVSVRNMTPGGLIYKSNRNVGYIVEWAEYNDEQPMEIMELKNMLASQRAFFERNWIWIDDPELVDHLGVAKYYKNMLSPDEVESMFDLEPGEMIIKIKALTKDMQNTIRVVAREKVLAGEVASYAAVQALEKYFGIVFGEEE